MQGSSGLFGSCSFVGDVPLLSPIFNQMVFHSAWTCQGSGTLQPGATASVTGRITPAASFNNSQFLAAYLLTFRRTGGIPGTNSLTSYGGVPIDVDNCTAIPQVSGAAPSGVPYVVSWNSTGTTAGYEIQEATRSDFSGALTLSEPTTSRVFTHTVGAATTYYYRVRPVICSGSSGSFGPSAQIVVLPQQPPTSRDFDLVVPLGTTAQVSQSVTFSGLTPNASFTVTTDKAYLTVTPSTGTVRSDGTVTVTVRTSPGSLPVGANTGTVSIGTASVPGKGLLFRTTAGPTARRCRSALSLR